MPLSTCKGCLTSFCYDDDDDDDELESRIASSHTPVTITYKGHLLIEVHWENCH